MLVFLPIYFWVLIGFIAIRVRRKNLERIESLAQQALFRNEILITICLNVKLYSSFNHRLYLKLRDDWNRTKKIQSESKLTDPFEIEIISKIIQFSPLFKLKIDIFIEIDKRDSYFSKQRQTLEDGLKHLSL